MTGFLLAWLAGCSCNEEPTAPPDLDTGLFLPQNPAGLNGRFIDVALSATHRCGLRDDGALACWGPQTVPVFDNYRFANIDGSGQQLCGITEKLDVVCISSAQGNTATFVDSILGGGPLDEFSAGPQLSQWCAVTNGRAVCDQMEFDDEPLTGAVRGVSIACAWSESTDPLCVEEDYYTKGKYTGTRDIEGVFDPGTRVRQITLFPRHCILDHEGEATCFPFEDQQALAKAPAGPFTRMWTAQDHACALTEDGHVACWGVNGQSTTTPAGAGFTELSMVRQLACAIDAQQQVLCWGLRK